MQKKLHILRCGDDAQDYLHKTKAYVSYVARCSKLSLNAIIGKAARLQKNPHNAPSPTLQEGRGGMLKKISV